MLVVGPIFYDPERVGKYPWCPSPGVGQEAGYTKERSPVHHRDTAIDTQTPKGNLKSLNAETVIVLDFGEKLEYQDGTHT